MKKNVALTGFMGTGKSTVGKKLAAELGWSFIDTDAEIEKSFDRTIPAIFKTEGESAFRAAERAVIRSLAEREHCVISTGGGTILDEQNREVLSGLAYIVALHAPLGTLLKRIGNNEDRPLLQKPVREIEALWESRRPFYGQADYSVDTADKSVDEIKDEIIAWLRRWSDGEMGTD